MAKSPFEIVLSSEERAELERRVACYTLLFKVVQRAKMVLYAADGFEQRRDRAAAGDGGRGGWALAETLLRGALGRP